MRQLLHGVQNGILQQQRIFGHLCMPAQVKILLSFHQYLVTHHQRVVCIGYQRNKHIFPASGSVNNTSFYNDSYGNNWSSSHYTYDINNSEYLYFYYGSVQPGYDINRYAGLTIRPVADIEAE